MLWSTHVLIAKSCVLWYNDIISHAATIMGSTKVYDDVQLQHYRVTLDMSVLGDFDPRQVNYAKVFDLQENEEVEAYVESLDSYDPWWLFDWHIGTVREQSI